MVARDRNNDLIGNRRDLQLAGLVGRLIVAGERAAVELNGAYVDHVCPLAGFGDGAFLRHGEGECFARVRRNDAVNGKLRLREGVAVVNSARTFRGNRQRNGIVDRRNVVIRRCVDGDRAGRAGRRRLLVARNKRLCRVHRYARADDGNAGGVLGDLHARPDEIVVDGVGGGVALEVYPQRQRAVRRHDAGEDVVRVVRFKHIRAAAGGLVLVGDGNGGVRRAGAAVGPRELVAAVGLLIVELNLIGSILVRLPLRVENVRGDAVHAGGRAERKARAAAVGGGVPAGERIARAGENRALERHHAVVGDLFFRHGALRAAVRHVHKREDALGIAPDGIERDAAFHAQLVVGLILDRPVRRLCPAEEHLALGNGEHIRLHISVRAGRILLRIINGGAAVGVSHRIAVLIGEVGVELDAGVDLGAEVEGDIGFAFLCRPADERPAVAFRRLRRGKRALVDGAAVGDGELLSAGAFHGNIGNAVDRGRYPVGVHRDVLRAHRAGEAMGMLSGRVVIPAKEDVVLLADGRRRRGLVCRGGDGLLVENTLAVGRDLATAVHIYNIVNVAGVIEFGVVVICFYFRADTGVECKAGDGVLILRRDCVAGAGGSIGMMQLVGLAADSGRPALTGQDFDIIVRRFRAVAGLRPIECGAVQRHRIDVDLIGAAATLLRCPRAAAVVSGPLVADGRAVFGGDAQGRVLRGAVLLEELYFVHIALIVHVHDGGAVARDGLLRDGLGGEAVVALGSGARLGAGRTGFGLRLREGKLRVVGVLLPVDDGVLRVGLGVPVRGKRNGIGQRAAKGKRRVAVIPAGERVAGAGRRAGVFRGSPGRIEYRRIVGAARGVEREPVTLFDLGVHKNIRVRQRDSIGALRAVGVKVPAGDGERRAFQTVRHTDGADALTALALLRQDDTAVLIDEEYIQHFLKPRLDGDFLRGGDAAHGAENAVGERRVGARYVPADEFIPVLLGRGGAVERVAVRDDLL